jgi:hypothetical protein
MLKFTLKFTLKRPYMFQSNGHHQGAHCLYFAKVITIKLIS